MVLSNEIVYFFFQLNYFKPPAGIDIGQSARW